MAFSVDYDPRGAEVLGRIKLVTGTWAQEAGDSGGTIPTTLRKVIHFEANYAGSSGATARPAIDTDFVNSDVTDVAITTATGAAVGSWIAFGE